jgi:predicted Zn-ribbon and HTH transcriptional regulator
MVEYRRTSGGDKPIMIAGTRCDKCGFTVLDNDEDIWSAVGL